MPHISYLSLYGRGRFLPHAQAYTHINDRGYQFADAVYEVVTVIEGKFLDFDRHIQRLRRTLSHLKIELSMSDKALYILCKTLLEKNKSYTGLVYFQISRGIALRNHAFPKDVKPVIVLTFTPWSVKKFNNRKPLSLKSFPDLRHKRCDLKTVALLPNILALEEAKSEGFDDALFYDENGFIREGSSWNFWIVDSEGNLKTRYLDEYILHGITRQTILELAETNNLKVEEANISFDDIKTARECFATSASKFAYPIRKIDDIELPNNHPIADKLFELYKAYWKI